MSKWSDEQALTVAHEIMKGDMPYLDLGRAILDLRERAEKAERFQANAESQRDEAHAKLRRRKEHLSGITGSRDHLLFVVDEVNEVLRKPAKERTADYLRATLDALTKRAEKAEQRCAALEAALVSARERCRDIFSGKVEDEALGDVVVALGAALSGDTSALRDKLLQMGGLVWAMAAPDVEVDANTINSAAESVMEGK